MDDLFADLICKIPNYKTVKPKSKNKNGSEYDFSGLLTIDDDF
jgi:hypothetical protein|tara:strand:+ start:240 stop:368 length:129 start_codon:yes stop_codon:yes gene_type:complete